MMSDEPQKQPRSQWLRGFLVLAFRISVNQVLLQNQFLRLKLQSHRSILLYKLLMNPLDKIKFDRLTIDNGLSQSAVNCIIQDCRGFMWFGTQDGLNRFDGKKFTVYKNDKSNNSSISNNFVYALFEDKDNNLWVGTINGLNRYDRRSDCFERFMSDNEPGSFPVDHIRSICQDNAGMLYLATYGGGLTIFDLSSERFNTIGFDTGKPDGLSYGKLNCLHKMGDGNLLIGTWGGGLDKYEVIAKKFSKIILTSEQEESVSHRRINNISSDAEGFIWVSTNGSLFRLEGNTLNAERQLLPSVIREQEAELISCSIHDSFGSLWIGTREKGLWLKKNSDGLYANYVHDEIQSESISNNSIMCIYEDSAGLLWVGTFGDGVNKFNPKKKNVLHFNHDPRDDSSINSNKINCFLECSDGKIWIGTRGMGVSILDPVTNEIKSLGADRTGKSSGQENVQALEEDHEGVVWMGTAVGGLISYNRQTNELQSFRHSNDDENSLINDTVFALEIDDEGTLWVGTSGGLNRYDKNSNEFKVVKKDPSDPGTLRSDRIRSLHFGSDKLLWITTEYGGLNSLDTKSNKMTFYPGNGDPIVDNVIMTIAEDPKGRIWIGSPSGLYMFEKERNRFTKFTEKEGLPNNFINTIIPDEEGFLWITTNNGVAKLDADGQVLRVFDKSNGFQSNEFNLNSALRISDGRIAVGGINGFNIFHPRGFSAGKFVPELAFTEFKIFNKSVTSGDDSPLKNSIWCESRIGLSYRESVISFSFAAMDFESPNRIQYKYMMEGFDKAWVSSGNTGSATYTNLDPGEYIFRVKATNSDGIWNEKDASIGINISPPFWKTIWFKTFGALTVAAAASAVYQNKLNQVRKEKKAQEEFTRRLIEAQETDRKRIAAELHDSIGHGLLISKNRLQLSLNEDNLNPHTASKIQDVSDMLSGTLNEVREISYNLHPYQIERLGISKAIRSIIDKVSESVKISFTCMIDEFDGLLSPEAEITLFRIVQECVNNIIKHSDATEAILNVSRDEREISLFISDNGKGIDLSALKSEKHKHGLGLEGMIERARIINAALNVNSAPGKGTNVKIVIPLKKIDEGSCIVD